MADSTSYLNYGARTTQLSYLGTLRGCLSNVPTPVLQVYGTGGLAYGGVISNTVLFTLQSNTTNWTFADASQHGAMVGWTAGGGFEWMFMPNWSLKAEYLYYDLGTAYTTGVNSLRNSFNTSTNVWTNLGTLTPNYGYGVSTHARFNGNVVHVGVNRHYDLMSD